MGRSVAQDVLWVSSTQKPKLYLAPPAFDAEYRKHHREIENISRISYLPLVALGTPSKSPQHQDLCPPTTPLENVTDLNSSVKAVIQRTMYYTHVHGYCRSS